MPRPLSPPRGRPAFPASVLFVLAMAVAVFFLSRWYPLRELVDWLHLRVVRCQPWSFLLYPLLIAVGNLLLLPGGILVVAAGFFFGVGPGFAAVLGGNLLGAAAAVATTRRWGRGRLERWLRRRPAGDRLRALDALLARDGGKVVFLTQLSPVMPTSLLNYLYGLSRIGYWPCLGWIALGQAPGMFLYVFLGRMGRFGWAPGQPLAGAPAAASAGTVAWWGHAAGLAATFGLVVLAGRVATRLLERASADLDGNRRAGPDSRRKEGGPWPPSGQPRH